MTSELNREGAFVYEPDISEQALADTIEGVWERLVPNEQTKIKQTFPLEIQATQESKLGLRRSKKAFEAALQHSVGSSVMIDFSVNVGWGTIDPQNITFALPGTDVLTAKLDFDSDSHRYYSRISDRTTDREIPRGEVATDVVIELLSSLGVQTRLDASNEASLINDLKANLKPGATLETEQHHVLSESDLGDGVVGRIEVRKTSVIGVDELWETTQFIETTEVGETKYARVVSFTNSMNGKDVSAEEIVYNPDTDENSRQKISLDYQLIEKLQRHFLLATTQEQL